MQSYLSEKISMLNNRMLEFDVRTNRLEDHCFNQQEPILIKVNKRFNDLKTEIYHRIENFSTTLANLKEKTEHYQ